MCWIKWSGCCLSKMRKHIWIVCAFLLTALQGVSIQCDYARYGCYCCRQPIDWSIAVHYAQFGSYTYIYRFKISGNISWFFAACNSRLCVCVCTPADHGTSHTCHMNRIQKNCGVQMNVRRTTLYQRQLNESMISLQFIYAYCAYGNLFNRSITSNQYKYSVYILCIHSVSDDTEVDMCINMKPTRLYHIIHNGHGQWTYTGCHCHRCWYHKFWKVSIEIRHCNWYEKKCAASQPTITSS